MSIPFLSRRQFCHNMGIGFAAATLLPGIVLAKASAFRLRYIVASCLYGELPLAELLPQLAETGSDFIDIWPRKHGNQREQLEEMGHEKFASLLQRHKTKL